MASTKLILLPLLLHQLLASVTALAHNAHNFSSSVYSLGLEKSDSTRNLLLSPVQITALIQNLEQPLNTAESAEVTTEDALQTLYLDSFERFRLQPPKTIRVSNKLFAANTSADTQKLLAHYSARLPNSKIEQRHLTPRRLKTMDLNAFELTNCISIQARWAFNFQKRDTHKRLFYNTPNIHVYMDSMRKDDIFPFARLQQLNATALQLPLQDAELTMLLLLPDDINGLRQLKTQLGDLNMLDAMITKRLRPTLVRVLMPIFKFKYRLDLRKLLEDTEIDANITKIQHEAEIEVNEDGLGRLERRTVLFWNAYSSLRTTPQIFDMNHPFFFIIRNPEGIQFVGHLARL